jgi:hypothetical protein
MTLWFLSSGGPLHHSVGLLASLHLGPRHHDLTHSVVRRLPNSLEPLAVCQAAIRVCCDLVAVVGSQNLGIYTRLHCPHHPSKRDVKYREPKLELPLTSNIRARKGDRRWERKRKREMPLWEIWANGNGGSSELDPRASSCRSEYRRGLVVGGALGIACHGYVVAADPPVAAALLLCFPIIGMVYLNQIARSSGLCSTS